MISAVAKQAAGPFEADSALMRKVADGDPQAQRLLALRLSPRVQRIAQRLLAAHADADDAAQNALIEILKAARSYKERGRVERWADRIAVRTILRCAREQRKPWSLSSGVAAEDIAAPTPSRYHEDTPRVLSAYLAELPRQRREVLVLKHALDYTTEEIAELVNAPIGTVKDRLVAARKQLRKLIQRDAVVGVKREAPDESA